MKLKNVLDENDLKIKDMAAALKKNECNMGRKLSNPYKLNLDEIIYLVKASGKNFEELFKEYF